MVSFVQGAYILSALLFILALAGLSKHETARRGNTLRALIKHQDKMSDEAVVPLNVPTGIPLRYELDATTMLPTRPGEYLDPDAAAAAIQAVANQGKK